MRQLLFPLFLHANSWHGVTGANQAAGGYPTVARKRSGLKEIRYAVLCDLGQNGHGAKIRPFALQRPGTTVAGAPWCLHRTRQKYEY